MNTHAYYQAALAGLRHVEARRPTGRRFGADADARWARFAGDLTTAERLDLLIRDADAQWPGAFGARTVFALDGVAEDEAFGPEWESLDAVDANELWRTPTDAAVESSAERSLAAAASAWRLRPAVDAVHAEHFTGPVDPAHRLLVVGPSAVAATVRAFAAGSDLDFGEQVVVVATPPAHRQVAALASALLNAPRGTALRLATDKTPLKRAHRLVASTDAAPEDLATARALTEA